ncbi:MAG: sulfite exporter TauE/SafE family protein [Bacteroidia bacterium]|nr:sulfite exporter TauE/SafE family protein [Bacteroidia bacterium]
MFVLEILGYIAAVLIGVTLGLIGGGGSILTVPVLVYLFSVDPVTATGYSLFIVGVSAAIGAYKKYRLGLTVIKVGIVFGIPSLLGVFLARSFLLPAIPEVLFNIGNTTVDKGMAIMVFFAIVMLLASYSMIKPSEQIKPSEIKKKWNYPLIALEGVVVGIFTGLVGAGGGFLIVPALIFLTGLPMKWAVGTSLMIIAIKSILGFTGDIISGVDIDWLLLFIITILSVVGIFIGSHFSNRVKGSSLKKGFGWFVLVMGVFVILKEVL